MPTYRHWFVRRREIALLVEGPITVVVGSAQSQVAGFMGRDAAIKSEPGIKKWHSLGEIPSRL